MNYTFEYYRQFVKDIPEVQVKPKPVPVAGCEMVRLTLALSGGWLIKYRYREVGGDFMDRCIE